MKRRIYEFSVRIHLGFDHHFERLVQIQLALVLQVIGIGSEILQCLLVDLIFFR